MKAVRINKYGGPEVMKIEDVERPVPAPDEVLVEVYASGVNPVDAAIRQGENESLRSFLKLPMTLGWDAAGIVTQTGSEVTSLKTGDQVYGVPNFPGDGSYAEYCVGKASQFAIKPQSLDFRQAAGVPLAALTAWTGIFGHGDLKPGERILIQGASGGVGSFAVQFAKAKGAYVIGMASTNNIGYVKELGADEVIDYKTQQFTELLHDLDVVLEASPIRDNSERVKAVSILKEGGTFVSVNTDLPFNDEMMEAAELRKIKVALAANEPRQEWLTQIAELIDAGKVQVLIDQVFPLEEVAEAQRQIATWHVRGRLVLNIKE
ncbi:NADP-dependent oxidoreductase [Mucilaginibacter sp. 21P]|uniref:NADP-dependent oxidoreductase n=1 Tax=Mucilaginibacter sp. 21P TaxID=2778902 RepID=UPI001C577E4D|nr:NADP-dependent oxidoreductase [Mucilaginibacter sp. 21P]QXV63977.1 NADP-dependent oxidoreductase [Mucilaginibacter sp. 21P]